MRRANGTGTVVKLSGNRRKPYEVRVNTRINEWGYPVYDVLDRFADRVEADGALADYNRSPFDVNKKTATFEEVYKMWFEWKYVKSTRKYSDSAKYCSTGAFKKCSELHNRPISQLRTDDFQKILDNHDLSHAYLEHIENLFHSVCQYALEYNIITKDYSQFISITKEDDDEPGVPFSNEEIRSLWACVDTIPFADTVLILIYTGWRITELLTMKTANIDLTAWTMGGGIKSAAGKNRIVPIHTGIRDLVERYYRPDNTYFLPGDTPSKHMPESAYRRAFAAVMAACGIQEKHTPHDCRHTFVSLLDKAGANEVCIDRLVGHASNSVSKRTYTHKSLEELRTAVELIEIDR